MFYLHKVSFKTQILPKIKGKLEALLTWNVQIINVLMMYYNAPFIQTQPLFKVEQ